MSNDEYLKLVNNVREMMAEMRESLGSIHQHWTVVTGYSAPFSIWDAARAMSSIIKDLDEESSSVTREITEPGREVDFEIEEAWWKNRIIH